MNKIIRKDNKICSWQPKELLLKDTNVIEYKVKMIDDKEVNLSLI